MRWCCTLAVLVAAANVGVGQDKAGPKDNIPPAGYTALFNGKDLTNWQGLVPINKRDKMSKEEYEAAVKAAIDRLHLGLTRARGMPDDAGAMIRFMRSNCCDILPDERPPLRAWPAPCARPER